MNAQAMTIRSLIRIRGSATLEDAARLMCDMSMGALGVDDADHHFVGLVTERDLLWAMAQGKDSGQTTVGDIVNDFPIVVDGPISSEKAAERMMSAHVRHLLVRDGDRLGIVSLRDVVRVRSPMGHRHTPTRRRRPPSCAGCSATPSYSDLHLRSAGARPSRRNRRPRRFRTRLGSSTGSGRGRGASSSPESGPQRAPRRTAGTRLAQVPRSIRGPSRGVVARCGRGIACSLDRKCGHRTVHSPIHEVADVFGGTVFSSRSRTALSVCSDLRRSTTRSLFMSSGWHSPAVFVRCDRPMACRPDAPGRTGSLS